MLYSFFHATAWPMTPLIPGQPGHIILVLFGITAAATLAFLLGRPLKTILRPQTVLFSCGLFLLFGELYKQGFLYFIVHQNRYNWWYFPFQLCSIPMYLCLLYPIACRRTRGHFQDTIATFLQDFAFLGGIMALLVPDGFLWPYLTLTLHGFLWHFLLVFLSLYCHICGLSSHNLPGFIRALSLYAFCCLTATFINTAVQLSVYPESYADMFYINCFFPSEQPVFHEISAALGNFWGHLAYALATCCGAWMIHCCFAHFHKTLESPANLCYGGRESKKQASGHKACPEVPIKNKEEFSKQP